jgi:isoleucyl-tRNA synthetase
VSEMREQIRLWFYSQLFMSVVLTGGAPFRQVLGYEKMLDEHGREMHGSHGNAIEATDAFDRMGADVMRWQYCAQPPDRNLLFGFGPAEQIKRELLTFWNSVSFFVAYANIEGFNPSWSSLGPRAELQTLDRWLLERTHAFVREAEAGYESWMTLDVMRAYTEYVDDLSNWYIRRSRSRFWAGELAALETLWYALVQTLRAMAPIMPFLTEHLWRSLVADGPDSVHLAPWPDVPEPDRALLDEIADVRRVVTLAHQARATSGLKLRQPLRRLVVEGAQGARAHADEIADEVRVKEVAFDRVDAELRVKPNLPVLGPRLGKELRAVQQALQSGDFEELDGGRFRAGGHELEPDEVLVERGASEGFAIASADGMTVALELGLDDDLLLEGRGYDLIRQVNSLRKEQGLELTDRIVLTLPAEDSELVERHGDWIKGETLAVDIRLDGNLGIEKVVSGE